GGCHGRQKRWWTRLLRGGSEGRLLTGRDRWRGAFRADSCPAGEPRVGPSTFGETARRHVLCASRLRHGRPRQECLRADGPVRGAHPHSRSTAVPTAAAPVRTPRRAHGWRAV